MEKERYHTPMLQFIIAVIISSFIISSSAWSKCLEQSALMNRVNAFTINLGSSDTINIPLNIDGQQACYHQESALGFKAESLSDATSVDFEITPLVAKFENVPAPQSFQYIDIDYKDDKASKVRIMNFLCSGEIPIGSDALAAVLNEEKDDTVSITISTGQVADNLQVTEERKAKAKVYFQFLKTFEVRNGVSVDDMKNSNIYIPTIIAENAVTASEYKLYTNFFNRTNSTLNGCSEAFKTKMQDFLIENVIKNQPFRSIDIRKKLFMNRYKMKWTL